MNNLFIEVVHLQTERKLGFHMVYPAISYDVEKKEVVAQLRSFRTNLVQDLKTKGGQLVAEKVSIFHVQNVEPENLINDVNEYVKENLHSIVNA